MPFVRQLRWCSVLGLVWLPWAPVLAQTTATEWVLQTLATPDAATEDTTPVAADDVDTASPPTTPVNTCAPPPMRVMQRCEVGGGFLCIDTPPGGTVAETATITGLVDRSGHAFAGLKVVVQHDQTKAFTEIATANVVGSDGRFSVVVPLSQLGSYTVVVQALRTTGDPAVKQVAVSRVIAPQAAQARVQLTPDPAATELVIGQQVEVQVDLLAQCERCDFIGSATGATTVTVTNTIVAEDGSSRRVQRETNVGVDGQYALCLPIASGNNHVRFKACNAAACIDLPPIDFAARDTRLRVRMIDPAPGRARVIPATKPQSLTLRFQVDGVAPSPETTTSECGDTVTLTWNRAPAVPVCAAVDGSYALTVTPEVGINLGVITVRAADEVLEYPVTIGWGRLQSPWEASGRLKASEDRWAADALTLGLRAELLTDALRELVNHAASSDEFSDLLARFVQSPGGNAASNAPFVPEAFAKGLAAQLPYCQLGSDEPRMHMELVGAPQIGRLEIMRIELTDDTVQLFLELADLVVHLRYFRDEGGDGVPDGAVLPLKIAFRRLQLQPLIRLIDGEEPVVQLTASATNCDYQSPLYCEPSPAIVLPSQFVGGATPVGGFVQCDTEEQAIPAARVAQCEALNIVNAQTGLLEETVLEALNQQLYCQGSTLLTYLLREATPTVTVRMGCVFPPAHTPVDGMTLDLLACDPHGALGDRAWELKQGLRVLQQGLHVGSDGIRARLASQIGSEAMWAALPKELRGSSLGYFTDLHAPRLPADFGLGAERDVALGVGEAWINELLMGLTLQGIPRGASQAAASSSGGGVLDWIIHEPWLEGLGVNVVDDCDVVGGEDDQPPSYCKLRPRVSEIFGTSLTTHGYFTPFHPLLIRTRASRQLMPHVRFYEDTVAMPVTVEGQVPEQRPAQLIALQIPELELSFYALAIDPAAVPDAYGNLPILRDANGAPQIQSLRPEDPDPWAGPILRTRMTLLLTLELIDLQPDPDDPSQLLLRVGTIPDHVRMAFTVDPGDNSTVVPAMSLLSALRDKLTIGISEFHDRDGSGRKAIRIPIPKRFVLPTEGVDGFAALLGIEEIRLRTPSLVLDVDPGQDFLRIGAGISFVQRLRHGGQVVEWAYPE